MCDEGAISHSLHKIGCFMTRSKIKRVKQVLQDLILKIKKKKDQCKLRISPNWITFLQIDKDALRST